MKPIMHKYKPLELELETFQAMLSSVKLQKEDFNSYSPAYSHDCRSFVELAG